MAKKKFSEKVVKLFKKKRELIIKQAVLKAVAEKMESEIEDVHHEIVEELFGIGWKKGVSIKADEYYLIWLKSLK